MKIENSVSTVAGLTGTTAPAKASAAPAAVAAAKSGDKVEISSLSSRMQQMESAMANTPVVDSARVAELKKAISEGRFQVHPEKVADSLIQSVQQMLQGQTRAA